jgi:hypothetical protein
MTILCVNFKIISLNYPFNLARLFYCYKIYITKRNGIVIFLLMLDKIITINNIYKVLFLCQCFKSQY